jgi:glycosyltransferase involved in cell wall biosynthesis
MTGAIANPVGRIDAGQDAFPAGRDKRRVALVTDIPTPYMLEVLKALGSLVDLTVTFCAQTGSRGMPWAPGETLPFEHQVIDGLTLRSDAPDRPDYYLSPRVLGALAKSRAEAVISFGFSIPTAYAAMYCRLRRAPLVIYSDGTSEYESSLGRHQLMARAILLRAASACVALSKPAAARFVELGVRPERVFLAPHSSTLDPLWRVAADREYERDEWVTVLTAGRLVRHKGVDKLLAATAEARRRNAKIRLVVVGTGPEEERLRTLATELDLDVEFAGFVDHAEMPARYADADVFAFPTLDDPFGIVLLEAAAAGLPLVSSHHAGASWDLIADPRDGLIVDPSDTAAFGDALVDLSRDPVRRRTLGERAHAATLGRSPLDSAQGYASAIETTIRDRGPARR